MAFSFAVIVAMFSVVFGDPITSKPPASGTTTKRSWAQVASGASTTSTPAMDDSQVESCETDQERFVREHPKKFKDIEKKFLTKRLCKVAVTADANNLEYVPYEYMTEDMCVQTLPKICGICENMQRLPVELRTPKIMLALFSSNPWYFVSYTDDIHTPEAYEAVVLQDPSLLHYVPEKFLTVELCCSLVLECMNQIYFHDFPKRNLIQVKAFINENYEEIVKKNPDAFKHLSYDMQTPEMYIRGVRANWKSAGFKPYKMAEDDPALLEAEEIVEAEFKKFSGKDAIKVLQQLEWKCRCL